MITGKICMTQSRIMIAYDLANAFTAHDNSLLMKYI